MIELTDDERLKRAEDAELMLNDPLCVEVMQTIKDDALAALSIVAADDTLTITRLQATIAVVDSFRGNLSDFITNVDGLTEKSGA